MSIQNSRGNSCFIHLTLVPYIPSAGEIRPSPPSTRSGTARNRYQPDVLLSGPTMVPDNERRKVALPPMSRKKR
jgi:CTP synthase